MADTTEMAEIRSKATHLVSLAKRSVITKMKRLPFLGGQDGSKDVDGQLRERLSSREQRQGICVSPQCQAVLGTSCAPGDGGVGVRYHQRPVICLSHGVVYSVHTRMGCHCGVVLERQDAFS